MKRQVVLKVESEKGNKEEYTIELKNSSNWDDILYALFDVNNLLTNKAKT